MIITLQNAINNAPTFANLVLIARQLEAKLSFWGRQYVVIEPKNGEEPLPYAGEALVGALVDRTQRIIKERGCNRYNYPERPEADLLDIQINRYMDADRINLERSHIITRIAVKVRKLFASIFIQNYKDHQFRWAGDGCCLLELGKHVLEPMPQQIIQWAPH